MINPPSDQGIPVLTEVISPETGEPTTSKSPIAGPAPAPTTTRAPGTTPAGASTSVANQTAGVTRTPSLSPTAAAPVRTVAPPTASPATPLTAAPQKTNVATVDTDIRPVMPNPDTQAGTSWNDEDWSHLETELRQRITRQVLGRIDFVLDHRVRSTLTDVIDNAIDGLATEIKQSLHASLTDMVARAVAQEIARIQPAKK